VATFTVVYDACLFYPAPLRDLMIRLAQTRRFRARWTEAIQREWLTALLHNRPELDEAKLARTMTLINQAVPDCLVTGCEHLTEQLSLPDPNDRHVLAAAIRCGAQAIVSMNLKDFPSETLAEFEIVPPPPRRLHPGSGGPRTGSRHRGGKAATRWAQGPVPLTGSLCQQIATARAAWCRGVLAERDRAHLTWPIRYGDRATRGPFEPHQRQRGRSR
jgi:hypothetical protein